jgi:cardiolipin synthase
MKILEALAAEGFCRVADAHNSSGNRVRLLVDGPQTYPAWLDAINNASETVHLENYIIQDDTAGANFADALIAAAGRGAKCRVLYDWLGCLTRTKAAFWRRLTDAGVEVRRYNPPHLANPFAWVSRDHRKVLYVDHKIAFTGGLCIGHDWMGDPARNIPPWRDTAIEIIGPAVRQIGAAFADSWAAAGPGYHPNEDMPDQHHDASVTLSLIAGRPRNMGLYRLEQLVAEIAEHKLWLTDGYFVATTAYVRALTGAARGGVDVRLLVPGASNWPLVGALSKSAYRPLLEAGVRVFEWNGPMLHAKTAVADGCWTRIGSSNSNLASWVSNRELDVTIKDDDLARQMEEMFCRDMENSTEVVMRRGASGMRRAVSSSGEAFARSSNTSAGRLLSGAIGLGSTLGASLSQHRHLGAAESQVVLGGGALLLALALMGLFLPRFIAYPLAFIALWFAVGLFLHALKLWKSGPAHPSGTP